MTKRRVPAAYKKFLADNRGAALDGKRPPFLPHFSGELPAMTFVRAVTDDFGDRAIDLEAHPQLFALAWLENQRAFLAVDNARVVMWWPEDGKLYPVAESLDAFVEALTQKRASLGQIKAAYKKADALSDDDKHEEALAVLDEVLVGRDFMPTIQMSLPDNLIEWVGACYRLRGTVAVLAPYARKTAIADSERDFRFAIAWHSIGFSSPAYAYIGLCETLVYEAGAYERALDEIAVILRSNKLEHSRDREYATFYVRKAEAFARFALGRDGDYAALAHLAGEDPERRFEELEEDLDRLADEYPKRAALAKQLRALVRKAE